MYILVFMTHTQLLYLHRAKFPLLSLNMSTLFLSSLVPRSSLTRPQAPPLGGGEPRPYSLTKKNGLVYKVEFLGVEWFSAF